MKNTMINSKEFEVVTGEKAKQAIINRIERANLYNTIFDIYGRPSNTKISIYNDWMEWFYDINNKDGMHTSRMGCICGGSSTFSIGAKYTSETGEKIYLYITKDHNKVVIA